MEASEIGRKGIQWVRFKRVNGVFGFPRAYRRCLGQCISVLEVFQGVYGVIYIYGRYECLACWFL